MFSKAKRFGVLNFLTLFQLSGEGSFSTVYLGESRVTKGGWVAIKVVQKHNLLNTKKIPNPLDGEDCGQLQDDQDDQEDLISNSMREQNEREIMRLVDKEIRIMSALDHPHVIHLEEVYEDENRVCFVMELAQGGEVFDRLVEKVRRFTPNSFWHSGCNSLQMQNFSVVKVHIFYSKPLSYDDCKKKNDLQRSFFFHNSHISISHFSK